MYTATCHSGTWIGDRRVIFTVEIMKMRVPQFLKKVLFVLSCCLGRQSSQRHEQEDPAPRAPTVGCSEGAELQLSRSPSQVLTGNGIETAPPPSDESSDQSSIGQETAGTDDERSVTCEVVEPGPQTTGPANDLQQCTCIYKFKHPLFEEDDFELRVQNTKVSLEYCVHGHNFSHVSSYIRVQNTTFHKVVFIRCTSDHWKSFEDVSASYVHSCEDGQSDRFQCHLPFKRGGELEFAVCYRACGEEHWDNNSGINYTVTHNQ